MNILKKYYKILILIIIILVIVFSPIKKFINIETLTQLINSIKETSYAPFVFILIYVIGVIFAIPGIALTALAGVIFGFWQGVLLVIIGSNIGCQATFFISKFFGKDLIKKIIKKESLINNITKQIDNNGFLIMLYMRLLPIFPFNGINYVAGLTSIKYKDYALATLIGMLPGTCVYVYISATAADVKDNPIGLIISIGVLILFTLATYLIRKKQKKIKEETEE